MGGRWEEALILSYKKYVKSITAVNHSILALSEVHQPAAARSCIRRVCGFNFTSPPITMDSAKTALAKTGN